MVLDCAGARYLSKVWEQLSLLALGLDPNQALTTRKARLRIIDLASLASTMRAERCSSTKNYRALMVPRGWGVEWVLQLRVKRS